MPISEKIFKIAYFKEKNIDNLLGNHKDTVLICQRLGSLTFIN